jgi:2-keto-4-pentenoate hydratase/2-oxohepta-3-ene-1,7-dioic acid hydratase in catechol pathway
VTVGIDFTAREVQKKAKDLGRPWTIAKGFDGSAVIGRWVELPPIDPEEKAKWTREQRMRQVQSLNFHLDINGQTVQQGCTSDMMYSIDELISYISRFFTLKTGDLLYTGTPAGVGPIHINDHVEGWLEGQKVLEFNCR